MPTVAVSSWFNDSPEADPQLPVVQRGVAAREATSPFFLPSSISYSTYTPQSSLLAATAAVPNQALTTLLTEALTQTPSPYPTAAVSATGWLPTAWFPGSPVAEAGEEQADQGMPSQKTAATAGDEIAEIVSQLPLLSPDLVEWDTWKSVATVQVTSQTGGQSHPELAELPPLDCLALPVKASPVAASTLPSQGQQFQVWVNGRMVGTVRRRRTAEYIAQKLRQLLQATDWQPEDIQPMIGHAYAAGRVNHEILFVADASMAMAANESYANIAIRWVNNLRVALGGKALALADIQMAVAGLTTTHHTFQGTASWYGPAFHGRQTATGEIFNQHALTAAHPSLPFGTQLKVRNLLNDRTVVIRINDRGPYIGDRSLDLSKAAAQCLGSESTGVIPYEATILTKATDEPDDSLLIGFQTAP